MTEYIELALLKAELNIPAEDETRNTSLTLNIQAASLAIDDRCGRSFGVDETPTTRVVPTRGNVLVERSYGTWAGTRLLVPDISTEAITVDGVTGFEPRFDGRPGWPITSLYLPSRAWSGTSVSITALWGWAAVPATIRQACLLQALRYARRPGSPEGVAGSAEWGLIAIPRLDPDVRALVEPYRTAGLA